jgi:general secretion pathway protein F
VQTFEYIGYDHSGSSRRGIARAESERALRRQFREGGVLLTRVRARRTVSRPWPGGARPDRGSLALLVRQLATLQQSGMPLDESLALLVDQAEGARARVLAGQWRDGLLAGYSLAQAMRQASMRSPEALVAAVAVAEETGHLATVLTRLADELEVAADNRGTLLKGLVYPAVMASVAVLVTVVLMTQVVPQVSRVLISHRVELPLLTRVMIAASEALRDWGWLLPLGCVALLAATALALRDPGRRQHLHALVLRLPVVGRWILLTVFGDWCRSLGTLLAGGVPVLPALRIAGSGVGNLALRAALVEVTEEVRRGQALHAALRRQPLVPPFVLHMVGSGEASSQLDAMLLRVADHYARALQSSVQTALKLLEPLIVVAMAAFVMLIVGAVLVPIVRMNQLV